MPTYVYEARDEPCERFEIYQSIHEAALDVHPDSGRPIRRVISGGLEIPRAPADPRKAPVVRHNDSCACCNPRTPR